MKDPKINLDRAGAALIIFATFAGIALIIAATRI